MAITAKPMKKYKTADVDVEALINRGGSVPQNQPVQETEPLKNLQLRLYPSKIAQIDEMIMQRPVRISRHLWLLEAIEEKLSREKKKAEKHQA